MFKITITSILVLFISCAVSAITSLDTEKSIHTKTVVDFYAPTEILHLSEIQILAIENPAAVQIVFNTTNKKYFAYSYTIGFWIEMDAQEISEEDAKTSFSCGSSFVDQRDGQVYQTVQIGSQCWMAENLNIGTQIQGNYNQKDNSIIEKYCYDDSMSSCKTYGGLYQWDEVMAYSTKSGSKGICPYEWHVPSDKEWKKLERQMGMSSKEVNACNWRGTNEGNQLKGDIKSIFWSANTYSEYDFNALPGGYRFAKGDFNSVELTTSFWSSSEDGAEAVNRYLFSNYAKEGRSYYDKSYGFSVRCIKDKFSVKNFLQEILY